MSDLRVKTCETCNFYETCELRCTVCEEWQGGADQYMGGLSEAIGVLLGRFLEANDMTYYYVATGVSMAVSILSGQDAAEALADLEHNLRSTHDAP